MQLIESEHIGNIDEPRLLLCSLGILWATTTQPLRRLSLKTFSPMLALPLIPLVEPLPAEFLDALLRA